MRRANGDANGDAHGNAGRRGRRPLPRIPREHHAPVPATLRPGVPPGRARRPRRAAPTGTSTGTPTGTRAAGDVGPYHGYPVNTMRPCRPRCVRVHRLVGRDVPGAPRQQGRPRGCPRGRGPPGTSAPTTPRTTQRHTPARTPWSDATSPARRANGDVHGDAHGYAGRRGRRPLPRHTRAHPMVGRDVPGAPRPRGRPRGCPRGHQRERGPPGTSAPTTPHARAHPMVGRDVPGASRPRGRPRGRQRERGPPRTSAPTRWTYISESFFRSA